MSVVTRPLRTFTKQSWPERDSDLLVRTALLPIEEAKQCWRLWKGRNDIDHCTWPQYKVLARLSGRISKIDPDCPEVPRLNGMAKAQWTKSQLDLSKAARAIDVLSDAGIDVMLLKSAALEALQLTNLTRRITSDIDLMVPESDFRQALELLWTKGWRNGCGFEGAHRRKMRNAGVNLVHQDGSDVDLHHQPVHMPFLGHDRCAELWRKKQSASFRGRRVFVPGANDLLVVTAMQGARRHIPGHKSGIMWVFDVVDLLERNDFEWAGVLNRAQRLNGSFALLSCLQYLRCELRIRIPDDVIEKLAIQCNQIGEAVEYFAQSPSSGHARLGLLPIRELVLIGCQQLFYIKAKKDLSLD